LSTADKLKTSLNRYAERFVFAQPSHLHTYPNSNHVPIQTENAAPERTKPLRLESNINYEVKNDRGKKQYNIADHMDFKGYWVAITCW
jgi:hypothetical protein